VTIDDLDQLEILGPMPEPGGGAEFLDAELFERSGAGSLAAGEVKFQFFEEAIFGTEVDLLDDAGFSVDASGANPVGVEAAFLLFVDEILHNRAIHII